MMLRWIVLIVLFANIVAALWLYSLREFRQVLPSSDPVSIAGPGIFLLGELSESEIAKNDTCVLYGAFTRLEQALRVSGALKPLAVRAALVTRDTAGTTDFGVNIAKEDLGGSPAQMVRVLEANDISSFELGHGELEGAISIGVFQSYEEAQELESKLRRLGYKAEIKEIPRLIRQYWLGLSEAEQGNIADFDWWGEAGQKITILKGEMPCERVASPPQFP